MKRLGAIVSLLSLLVLVAACNDPASDVNKAVTSEAQKAASPQTVGPADRVLEQRTAAGLGGGTRRAPPCSAAGRSNDARHGEPPTTWAV